MNSSGMSLNQSATHFFRLSAFIQWIRKIEKGEPALNRQSHPQSKSLRIKRLIIVGLLAAAPLAAMAESLPPIQGGDSSGYTNYGSNPQYTQQPQYTQVAPAPYGQMAPVQQPYQPYNNGQTYNNGYAPQQTLQGYVATAPAGTMVPATLSTAISSDYARVGDRFTASLGSALAAGGSVLLPAGSQVEGQVVMVQPAGRFGKSGELEVRFTSAVTPTGQRIPLSARIQTEDGTGIIKGSTAMGRAGGAALRTGGGAALGAALGTAMGPLSGGKVGKGAIYGTILGAGTGAVAAGLNKGKAAVIETGEPVNIVLDQPLTASPVTPGANYQQQPYQQQYQPQPQPYNFYGQ